MPVYNGESTIRRALDSLLAQTLPDFEVVVSDNASTDRTETICGEYAARDPRVRYYRNPTNLGQIANFNRVFELSRGEYFRWVGCNDWWSPYYAERCAAALDAHPEAIMASCFHEYHGDDGRVWYEEYHGPRVTSPQAHKRFIRMLWFFRASRYFFDPIYSMHRRKTLEKTALLRMMLGADYVLAAELSLLGPAVHVPEKLVFQHVTPPASADEQIKRFNPRQTKARGYFLRVCGEFGKIVLAYPMSAWQKASCLLAIAWLLVAVLERSLRQGIRRKLALRCWARTILTLLKRAEQA